MRKNTLSLCTCNDSIVSFKVQTWSSVYTVSDAMSDAWTTFKHAFIICFHGKSYFSIKIVLAVVWAVSCSFIEYFKRFSVRSTLLGSFSYKIPVWKYPKTSKSSCSYKWHKSWSHICLKWKKLNWLRFIQLNTDAEWLLLSDTKIPIPFRFNRRQKVEKKIGNKNHLPIFVAFQFLKNIGIAPIYWKLI